MVFDVFQQGVLGIVLFSFCDGEEQIKARSCSPLAFGNVIYRGQFAGTVSPEPMASRYDGALSEVRYFPDQLVATFVRYADTDPLCCPSRPSVLATYRIVVTPGGPSLEPVDRG